jgi:hypothetical protein
VRSLFDRQAAVVIIHLVAACFSVFIRPPGPTEPPSNGPCNYGSDEILEHGLRELRGHKMESSLVIHVTQDYGSTTIRELIYSTFHSSMLFP